jgi:hypothetical protein
MDANALVQWKTQITAHQQRTRERFIVQQTTLFDVVLAHCKADQIDPFSLQGKRILKLENEKRKAI